MKRQVIDPRFTFETLKAAVNRWRADHAPHLTRDEAVRHMLGEWLESRGYLPAPSATPARSDLPMPATRSSVESPAAASRAA